MNLQINQPRKRKKSKRKACRPCKNYNSIVKHYFGKIESKDDMVVPPQGESIDQKGESIGLKNKSFVYFSWNEKY